MELGPVIVSEFVPTPVVGATPGMNELITAIADIILGTPEGRKTVSTENFSRQCF